MQVQTFNIEPYVAIGKFIKVVLIGKRRKQQTDNRYYVALCYVGLNTQSINEVTTIEHEYSLSDI